jgi:hypothetical protein
MIPLRQPIFLRVYRQLISLYPRTFRIAYAEQAMLTARDWYSDAAGAGRLGHFYWQTCRDLLISLPREHWNDIRRQVVRQPIVFHTVGLILALTVLGAVAAVAMQQMLRRGANQPQEQMVELYSSKLAGGAAPQDVIPAGRIDLANSLEPFLTFYDEHGQPLRSNGFLDSASPIPPPGVFDYMRANGSDTLTWQPRPGVRIAMVGRRVDGPTPGFLLVGRSMRVVEEYEDTLRRMVLAGWVLVVAMLAGGAALLTRASRLRVAA